MCKERVNLCVWLTCIVSAFGFFNFDHIGTEICEQHRRGWGGENSGEIDHADPAQGRWHSFGHMESASG
jgi:hypothetical protein